MLWNTWADLWNGDYPVAERIIDSDLRVHTTLMDGSSSEHIRGPDGLTAWIVGTRQVFPDLRFGTEVGPITDGDYLVGRWRAEGSYAGGLPGVDAVAGTPVDFTGTDILRLREGKIVEYWLNTDTVALMRQLG